MWVFTFLFPAQMGPVCISQIKSRAPWFLQAYLSMGRISFSQFLTLPLGSTTQAWIWREGICGCVVSWLNCREGHPNTRVSASSHPFGFHRPFPQGPVLGPAIAFPDRPLLCRAAQELMLVALQHHGCWFGDSPGRGSPVAACGYVLGWGQRSS